MPTVEEGSYLYIITSEGYSHDFGSNEVKRENGEM
jgi:hypothetical protein